MAELTDRAEEILERLWVLTQEQGGAAPIELFREDEAYEALTQRGLAREADGRAELTADGRGEAARCIRRHRLAERLLADVLAGTDEEVHRAGCKFEHGLHRGLEERVCTMLGHPDRCPHGKPIPRGECCRRMARAAGPLLCSAAELEPNRPAVIAFLETDEAGDLRKLMAIGALPGQEVVVRQRFPSYLIEMGGSQFAMDKAMAAQIHVRRAEP